MNYSSKPVELEIIQERITSQIGRGNFSILATPVTDTATANNKVRRADSLVLALNPAITDTAAQLSYLTTLTNRQKDTCEAYWYHTDHLGSSSWITDSAGNPVQHLHYLPWGEDYVNQRLNDFNGVRYTFSAKEKDSETGLSYFGSRYYSSDLSIWLSVDPMSDKYPSTSPYAYCRNNPIILVDPNGMFDTKAEARKYRREHHTGGVVRKNYSKENNVFAGKYSIFNKRKALSYTKPSYTQDDASIPMAGLNSDGVVVSPIAHDRRTRREKFDDFEMRFTNGSVNVLQSAYIFLVSPINDVCVLIKGQDIYGTPASETDKKFSVAGLLTFGTSKYLKGVRYIKETNKYIIPEIGTSAAGLYMDIRSGYKTYQNKKNNEKKDN